MLISKEVLILSGGMGTRIKEVLGEVPKVMAPVSNNPFLFYAINYFLSQGIEKFIFLLGYKYEIIQEYLEKEFPQLNKEYVIEKDPLGTGGAIFEGAQLCSGKNFFAANGDTFFKADLRNMESQHILKNADCSIALKPMESFDRYGSVKFNEDFKINQFIEKKYCSAGYINGGIYLINKEQFLKNEFPKVFSFEKNYLENDQIQKNVYGSVQDAYFIDIGIPTDYARSQIELTDHL